MVHLLNYNFLLLINSNYKKNKKKDFNNHNIINIKIEKIN